MLKATTVIFTLFITTVNSLAYSGTIIKSQQYAENQVTDANKETNSPKLNYEKAYNQKIKLIEGSDTGGGPRKTQEKKDAGTVNVESSDNGGGPRSPKR